MKIHPSNIDIPFDTFKLFKFRTKKQMFDFLLFLELRNSEKEKYTPVYIFLIVQDGEYFKRYHKKHYSKSAQSVGVMLPVKKKKKQPHIYYTLFESFPEHIAQTIRLYGMLYRKKHGLFLYFTIKAPISEDKCTLEDMCSSYFDYEIYSRIYIDSLCKNTYRISEYPISFAGLRERKD